MIESKEELNAYIKADRKRMPVSHPFLAFLTYGESWCLREYLTILRHLEYRKNLYEKERDKIKKYPKKQLIVYLAFFFGGGMSVV